MSYCEFVKNSTKPTAQTIHKEYHDHHYGFPIHNDRELFERLVLEINQAGLSWETILKKQENFKAAYHDFDIKLVANYTQEDRDRLMQDAGIIRNRLKINAAIENAKKILELQSEFGSFDQWLQHHHPKTKEEWVKIFKKNFYFTGGEIVNEFLMSIGYLPGAHEETCPIYQKVMEQNPKWIVK